MAVRLTQWASTAVCGSIASLLSILLMRAAGLGFPLPNAWQAWPQWLVFCAVTFTAMELVQAIVRRTGLAPRPLRRA